jgi:predicted nucleic acid-binding protein
VIAIDVNLLVYAHVTSYAQDEAAGAWLEEQLVAGLEWFNPLQPA